MVTRAAPLTTCRSGWIWRSEADARSNGLEPEPSKAPIFGFSKSRPTERPVFSTLRKPRAYPAPRCASSGKGHSHAATHELTLSCSPSGATMRNRFQKALHGAQVPGEIPEDERPVRPKGRRRFLSNDHVVLGIDPMTSGRKVPRVAPADDILLFRLFGVAKEKAPERSPGRFLFH